VIWFIFFLGRSPSFIDSGFVTVFLSSGRDSSIIRKFLFITFLWVFFPS